jgi:hypothetical protein
MNASVTSARAARVTTKDPAQAIRNAKNAAVPHCPGDTHTCFVASSSATRAPSVGLKTCLPRTLIRNLLAIATTAARQAMAWTFVRNSRHSDSPEIRALRELDANRTGDPLSQSPIL